MIEFSDILTDISRAEFLKNNSLVAFAYNNGTVELRDVDSFGQVTTLRAGEDRPTAVVFSPDCEHYMIVYSKKSTVEVFSIRGELTATIVDQGAGIENAIWAPDSGQVLVFSSFQIRVSIYNMFNNTRLFIRNPKYSSKGCSFSHDGRFMALAERR